MGLQLYLWFRSFMMGSRYIVRCLYYSSSAFILNLVGMNVWIESHNSNTCNCPFTSSQDATVSDLASWMTLGGGGFRSSSTYCNNVHKGSRFLIYSCPFLRMHFFCSFKNLFVYYLSILGWPGSSLLCAGFLQVGQTEVTGHCRVGAPECGLSSCGIGT